MHVFLNHPLSIELRADLLNTGFDTIKPAKGEATLIAVEEHGEDLIFENRVNA